MDKSTCSFSQLPFSKLFNTYISDYQSLSDFFSYNPFDAKDIQKRADELSAGSASLKNREEVVAALKDFHEELGISEAQSNPLKKFSNTECLTVVTGQQLGMYGGPLFTIYKTMTTILLARKLEKDLGKPVVPVFWLADEDHDFEEIASIGIPGNDALITVDLPEKGDGMPVSVQRLDGNITDFEEEAKAALFDTDFSEALWASLRKHYHKGRTHAQAFAGLMNEWFAEYGVLIAGSNFKPVKKITSKVFADSIEKSSELFESLEVQSSALEKEYHRQVIISESNLFYIDSKEGRVKIEKSGTEWKVGDLILSEEKLISMINANPEKFSPNVFLRPVLQDEILPTIGYVAGPGELAYYAQMKPLYPFFGKTMPAIFPRLSITLIESGIERIMEKLPFKIGDYNQRIEDLEAAYVDHTNSFDVDGVFGKWKSSLNELAQEPTDFIKQIDPTLEGTTGKVVAGFSNELDKLKGKVFRSIKQQEQTQLKRISRIKAQLFPDGLQERSVSPIYFENKYGAEVWAGIFGQFSEEELDLRNHHVITL